MKQLTERQAQVLEFCRDYLQRFDCFPAYRTIAKAMGWKIDSTNAIRQLLLLLQRKGYLQQWQDDFGGKGWRFTRAL